MIVADKPFGRWVWLVLAACWFATMGWRPLLDPDEGRYAEIPREMWVSGDWITPRLNGIKYFEKPPLQYWATAAAYSVFGNSEWTARLWALGLTFLGIPLAYGFARSMYGEHAAGIAAALAVAANPFYVSVGQLNLLDGAFAFLMVAAVFSFLRSRRAMPPAEQHRWMLLTWLLLAGAVLSKGIVALVLAGSTLVAYSALTRDGSVWRRWYFGTGLPLFLIVTVPWFWAVARRHSEFLSFFFVHEHFARFLTTVHERKGPWWYFLPLVLLAVIPWVTRVWPALRSAWQPPSQHGDRALIGRFLLVWCAVVLVFFSVSQSKLPPYIMPMMVPLAVLLGGPIAADVRSLRQAGWIVAALTTFVAIGIVLYAAHARGAVPTALWLGSMVAMASSIASLLWLRRVPMNGTVARHLAAFACCSILGWQALLTSYEALPPTRTAKPLVAIVRTAVRPGTALYSVGQYRQTIAPYLGRTLRLADFRGELEFGLANENVPYLPTLDAFIVEWQQSTDAIAFVSPSAYAKLRERGAPMQEIASDGHTVVLSRRAAVAQR